ncbi:MAG: nuclear transport factor 2 family protein [Chitinophagaceae bacterium]
MIRFLSTFLSMLVLAACNNARSDNKTSVVSAELLALERKWLVAEFALDTAALSELMDPSFISISEEGIKNKNEDLIAMYNNIMQRRRDSISIDSFRLDTPIVSIYDNSAVVTFIVQSFGKQKGASRQRRTRFYDVWIGRNGKWKAVSSQGTSL